MATIFDIAAQGAILGLESLIENLAYIENIFHKTRFPEELIAHVNDSVRGESKSEDWAARALNNVFVHLVYLRHVEAYPSGNVHAAKEDRIFGRIHEGISRSVLRMLRVDANGDPFPAPEEPEALKRFKEREAAATRIAVAAHHLLSVTYSNWRSKSLVPDKQVINLLELDQ